jgi:hypothetical protein
MKVVAAVLDRVCRSIGFEHVGTAVSETLNHLSQTADHRNLLTV